MTTHIRRGCGSRKLRGSQGWKDLPGCWAKIRSASSPWPAFLILFAHGWLTVSAGCSLSLWRARAAELGGNDSLAEAGLYLLWPHLLAQAPHLWSSGVEGCPTELGFLPLHVSHCLNWERQGLLEGAVSACRSHLSLACGGTFLPWVLRRCSLCVLGVGLPGRWRLGSGPLGFC